MKAIITVDLGFGDSGKGTIVDSLVQRYNAKLVVRYNGAFQAAHNVYQDNVNHVFSQFSSGTFSGAKTLLGPGVVVNPLAMLAEAEALNKKGISNPLSLINISNSCVITTPYHKALNQIRELSRKRNHGSTGTGVGETKRMSSLSHTLRVRDIGDEEYSDISKLLAIIESCYAECQRLIFDYDLSGAEIVESMKCFDNPEYFRALVAMYCEWARQVNRIGTLEVANLIKENKDAIVFEGAQGVLLDQKHGFHPYTTWGDITTTGAIRLLELTDKLGTWNPQIVGITRTFATRHGAGPFVTESTDCQSLIQDDDNTYGRFQGALRVGHLDLMTLKYAAAIAKINCLAITHCDKLSQSQTEQVCIGYEGADLTSYHCEKEAGGKALEFTKALLKTKPVYTNVDNVPAFLAKELAVPVLVTSASKQTKDKTYGTNA